MSESLFEAEGRMNREKAENQQKLESVQEQLADTHVRRKYSRRCFILFLYFEVFLMFFCQFSPVPSQKFLLIIDLILHLYFQISHKIILFRLRPYG